MEGTSTVVTPPSFFWASSVLRLGITMQLLPGVQLAGVATLRDETKRGGGAENNNNKSLAIRVEGRGVVLIVKA